MNRENKTRYMKMVHVEIQMKGLIQMGLVWIWMIARAAIILIKNGHFEMTNCRQNVENSEN